MKAVGKYLIIKEIKEAPKKTEGGLIMSEAHKEDIRYRKAEVINTGTHVEVVKDNDLILFDRHAGNPVEIEGEVFKVITEADIVVVL